MDCTVDGGLQWGNVQVSLQLGGCLSISAEELDSFKVIFKLTPLRAERYTPWDFLQLVQGSQGCARAGKINPSLM
ncbi:Sodium Channel Subunit Beta-1 [Manis pentadactyla]|nr:Sodium Channel Subunit Beta-1 [Manis pentadactyla]